MLERFDGSRGEHLQVCSNTARDREHERRPSGGPPQAAGIRPSRRGRRPAENHKLQSAVREVKAFLKDGFHLVVCRFVDTADYVARHLRGALPDQVRVESVSGRLPPAECESEFKIHLTRSDLHTFPAERTAIRSVPEIKRPSTHSYTKASSSAARLFQIVRSKGSSGRGALNQGCSYTQFRSSS